MKKFYLFLISVILLFCTQAETYSRNSHCNHSHSHNHHNYYRSSSHSENVYVINREYNKKEQKFPNCDKHYMEVETIVTYYSNGSRRIYTNCTIYNKDGTVLEANCQGVKHILYNNQHYFIIRKNGYYIIDSDGSVITKHKYSMIDDFEPNRLIVKLNKKYGIIDLKENIIVPIKYQKFYPDGNGVFVSKLNGYWGIVDKNNKILINHDCERIKSIHDTIMLKRYGKYGLTDLDGKIIYPIEYDKIRPIGEYIKVKQNNKYFVLNYDGERINNFTYKKIKLERNNLFGYTDDKNWVKIDKL